VADSVEAIHRVRLYGLLEISQLALGAADVKLVIRAIDCQTGRIVSPILQPLQTF
jgi:hypothetical protein